MTWLKLEAVQFSYASTKTNSGVAGTGVEYDFSLQLGVGEILAVCGKSGSGKSTLIDLITGFLRPTSGRIILDSTDITSLPPSKRQVSVLFQNNNLFEHMGVLENVCLGLNPNSSPTTEQKQQAKHMLARVGLANYENRRADSLSGGQMQRTALARELLRGSKLILLDEPFNGLDEETRDIMLPLLKYATAEQKSSILLVTHDLKSVEEIIDGTGEVREGRFQRLR